MTEREQERAAIVAWLRRDEVQLIGAEFESADALAEAIERGDHQRKDHD